MGIYIIAFERGARNRYESVDRERFRVFGHAGDGSKKLNVIRDNRTEIKKNLLCNFINQSYSITVRFS